MANIGTFTKTEIGFVGEIVTLTFQANNVRLVPEATGTDNAPSHRAYVGRAEIGSAEVGSAEVGHDKIGFAEIGSDAWMLLTPSVPDLDPLLENGELLLVRHVRVTLPAAHP